MRQAIVPLLCLSLQLLGGCAPWHAQSTDGETNAAKAVEDLGGVTAGGAGPQSGHVIAVSLHHGQLEARDLSLLGQFPLLRQLDLSGSGVTDEGLPALTGLRFLQVLQLRHTRITDRGLELLRDVGDLRWLDLAGTRVTDKGMKELKRHQDLHSLELAGTGVTDAGLQHLKDLKALEELSLGEGITDAGLAELRKLRALTCLDLVASPISNEGLAQLAEITGLRRLGLYYTRITDRGMQHLASFSNLEGLLLDGTKVTDAGVRTLARVAPGLKELSLTETLVTDAGMKDVANLQQLEAIWLSDSISARGLMELRDCPKLRRLSLAGKILGATLAEVRALRRLEVLNLRIPQMTDEILEELKSLGALKAIELHCPGLTSMREGEIRQALPDTELLINWDAFRTCPPGPHAVAHRPMAAAGSVAFTLALPQKGQRPSERADAPARPNRPLPAMIAGQKGERRRRAQVAHGARLTKTCQHLTVVRPA